MASYVINNRRYRVTSKSKFILSSLFITTIFVITIAAIITFAINYINETNARKELERQQQELAMLKEKYSFTVGDIQIEATSADEALSKLISKVEIVLQEKDQKIIDQQNIIIGLEEKYQTEIAQVKEVTRHEVKLYNEFAYAIDHPDSDITLEDIKMIVQICEEENVNPHLWLSLVKLESGFKSTARSSKSTAAGWGQVLKGTGRFLYEDSLKLGKYNHEKMGTNKEINARMSIHYLALLIEEKGSIERALIAYNGNELGEKYVSIVDANLKKYAGLSLSKLSKANSV